MKKTIKTKAVNSNKEYKTNYCEYCGTFTMRNNKCINVHHVLNKNLKIKKINK